MVCKRHGWTKIVKKSCVPSPTAAQGHCIFKFLVLKLAIKLCLQQSPTGTALHIDQISSQNPRAGITYISRRACTYPPPMGAQTITL
ncbi:hypothetical protein GDO81_021852 [Engystomops pustulosus]|uniref:Uncharacterized protein n=1 Tax=Engystomops pustulosus TaxID=76066 RepID=A0AAV6ZJJ7_ENGPU|nr:hypothetical protein GDO81_021852 [Engystomops pustulosus]